MLKNIDNNGFTLIELVVAILIFAIGIVGAAKMQAEAVRSNSYSMHMTEAVNTAENQIEQLMALGTDDADLSFGNHTASGNSDLTWVVSTLATNPDVLTVDVQASWVEKSENHQITISFMR